MSKEEQLDAYFDGSLSEEEKVEFEQRLMHDPSFKEEFEFQQSLRQSLRKREHEQIREMFARENASVPTKTFRIRRFIPALIAASLLLMATIGYFLLTSPPPSDYSQLFVAYFEPYENVIHPIERGNPMEDLRSRAFYAYENQQYEDAIDLFRQLAEQQPDPYIDFYSGIVLLQLDRNKEAVDRFHRYLDLEGKLEDRATWYLALSYLKIGDTAKASVLLREIISADGYKSEQAEAILDQMD